MSYLSAHCLQGYESLAEMLSEEVGRVIATVRQCTRWQGVPHLSSSFSRAYRLNWELWVNMVDAPLYCQICR